MPHFFKYSKNGRKQPRAGHKQRTYAKSNGSVMNRICARFDDIGNINMNLANVPPFNWQMIMPQQTGLIRQDVVSAFCDLDSSATVNLIEAGSAQERNKELTMTYDMLKETIVHEMISLCGTLEEAYVHVAKYLFTGENTMKASHKQMFWRVFGDLALGYLVGNLADCYICPNCHASVPAWSRNHLCPKETKGLVVCIDCGVVASRSGPKQCRCDTCQTQYRKAYYRQWKRASRNKAAPV